MSFVRYFCVLVCLLLAATASASPELKPHSAEYKVKISLVSGRLNTELRRTEDGYVANHVIRPTGLSKMITRGMMDVTSEFSSEQDGVEPIRFQSVDTIRKDPDVDLNFNWDTNQVTGSVGAESIELQLEGISYDSVSLQYELMHDLLNGNSNEQYVLFDVDKLRVVNVTRVGSKQVKTKAGQFEAVGIRHQKEGSSRVTTMWCVEELGYLPVVIEQHRKGKLNFEATLVRYTPTQE